MGKNRAGFILVLIILLLLTGCMDVDIELTVNTDGSGEVLYRISMDSFFYSLVKENDSDPFAEIIEEAENEDFSVSTFQGIKTGIEVRKKIENIGDQINGLSITEESGLEHLEITEGFLKNLYILDTNFDLTAFDNGFAGETEQLIGENLRDVLRFTFTLHLPVKPTRHNASAEDNDGKTLIWNLTPGSTNSIYMEAEVLNVKNIGIMTGLLLVTTVVIVMFLLVRKKRQNP
ncbi:DUF3153 domain-containing protein [Candidatus Contubernalis alkaliaceticus]|uniref:DUF3153 domain-containing protein n=1 Tax=Candidatus Contubernalis alkaliaceticus TaxID=338645 RepID=UPI001F4BF9FA|nr:DUF3153 domain-containing protein [Candidatus Contubernalis alkalaceticus]UNC92323.1 DUF3153 domain-containing protein [Candidatus Contubernalis alkalaceticus]